MLQELERYCCSMPLPSVLVKKTSFLPLHVNWCLTPRAFNILSLFYILLYSLFSAHDSQICPSNGIPQILHVWFLLFHPEYSLNILSIMSLNPGIQFSLDLLMRFFSNFFILIYWHFHFQNFKLIYSQHLYVSTEFLYLSVWLTSFNCLFSLNSFILFMSSFFH